MIPYIEPGDIIEFDYVNWEGKPGHRVARVWRFTFGSTEYHPEVQWLMVAYDFVKHTERTFAMKDMTNVKLLDESRRLQQ